MPDSFGSGAGEFGLLGTYFLALLAGAFAPGRPTNLAALALLLGISVLDLVVNMRGE